MSLDNRGCGCPYCSCISWLWYRGALGLLLFSSIPPAWNFPKAGLYNFSVIGGHMQHCMWPRVCILCSLHAAGAAPQGLPYCMGCARSKQTPRLPWRRHTAPAPSICIGGMWTPSPFFAIWQWERQLPEPAGCMQTSCGLPCRQPSDQGLNYILTLGGGSAAVPARSQKEPLPPPLPEAWKGPGKGSRLLWGSLNPPSPQAPPVIWTLPLIQK